MQLLTFLVKALLTQARYVQRTLALGWGLHGWTPLGRSSASPELYTCGCLWKVKLPMSTGS